MATPQPLLEMSDIVKTFPGGVTANDRIDFSVQSGEIHALLGENGAGKSTLMKILYGIYSPDSGEIRLRGTRMEIDSPKEAIEAGIGMVHQHFKLVGRLTVEENIRLGATEGHRTDRAASPGSPSIFDRVLERFRSSNSRPDRESIQTLVDEYGLGIDLDATVWELDVGVRQRVEILKTLYNDVDLLILDEPTATLPEQEKTEFFDVLRQLRDDGTAIILITHKLREVGEIADRTTVLRNGRVVDTLDVSEADRARLAEMMVGREVLFDIERRPSNPSTVKLEVEGLTAEDDRGFQVLDGVDISLRGGEIVGLAGISGNGQEQLAECLAGLREPTGGRIEIDGTDLTNAPPRRFIETGLSYIPADRYEYGCAPEMSVMHNAILKNFERFTTRGSIDYEQAHEFTRNLIEEYDIRAQSTRVETDKLSGGNLQKLIVGRELSQEPEILLAHHPTRGVDVGSMEYIREVILDQKETGTGIFLISDDLDEVLQMSDRILVIYEGQIVHRVDGDEVDRQEIGRYMTSGGSGEAEEASISVGKKA